MSQPLSIVSEPPPALKLADEEAAPVFDIRKLTHAQRIELLQRRDLVTALNGFLLSSKRPVGKTDFQIKQEFFALKIAAGEKCPAVRTLERWLTDWRESGELGLVDARWRQGRPEAKPEGDPFIDQVLKFYLTQRRWTKKLCFAMAVELAGPRGWHVPSYRTVCRTLDAIPAKTLALHRRGDKKFEASHGNYIARDYSGLASNQVWESDHRQFDVWVNAGTKERPELVRPWLTSWMDVRSRFIVGWTINPAAGDSGTILKAFRIGGDRHGFPESVRVDNGKDYDSYALQGLTKIQRRRMTRSCESLPVEAGLWPLLGIAVFHARPFNAKSKTIESWHRTIRLQFCPLWETFCGSSPEDRPADLQKHLDAGRAPMLDEFRMAFGDWIESYHHAGHEGDAMEGKSPAEVFAANLRGKRTVPQHVLDMICLRQTQPITVRRNGVEHNGLFYGAHNPKLMELEGKAKAVFLRVDDDDLSKVFVFRVDGSLICEAKCNERLPAAGATRQQLNAALADQRRAKRTIRDYCEIRSQVYDSPADLLHRKAAELRANPPAGSAPSPVSLVPIQTSIDASANRVRADAQAKKEWAEKEAAEEPGVFSYRRLKGFEPEPEPDLGPSMFEIMQARERRLNESRQQLAKDCPTERATA